VNVVLDDRLLIEELLVAVVDRGATAHHCLLYYRACRAAVLGAAGIFWTIRELEPQDQERAISAMLQLPNDIGFLTHDNSYAHVEIAAPPKLNLLNLERGCGRALAPRSGCRQRQRTESCRCSRWRTSSVEIVTPNDADATRNGARARAVNGTGIGPNRF